MDPASCLHSLLPPPRSTVITSRLRSFQTFTKVYTRTKRYCSSYNMDSTITNSSVSSVRDLGVFIDNDLGAGPPTFGELCHAASLHCTSFVTFVTMSLKTVFVHSLCRLYTPGSTTAISSWSVFRHIYSGNSSPFSSLQLVWCFVYVATTMSQTPVQFYHNAGGLQGRCHGVSCILHGLVPPLSLIHI